MDRALDISNYSGRLNTKQCEWLRDRYDLVIVRLSTEDGHGQRDIAAQQVSALATAHIPWQGYLWMYWDQYPGELWRLATEKLPPSWPGYAGLGIWIDLEDTPSDIQLAETCLEAYLDILETEDFQPGVYTGEWWIEKNPWIRRGAIGKKLSSVPAWLANYGIEPTCEVPHSGPFREIAMHQYASHDFLGPLMACDESLVCRIV